MSNIQVTVNAGSSLRLLTAGKYCPQDIVVTADNGLADAIIDKTMVKIRNTTVTSIGPYVFYNCSFLTEVVFEEAHDIKAYAFYNCAKLETADFSTLESIGGYALRGCQALTALVLRANHMAALTNTNAFTDTPIENGTGYVYVPDDLVDSYKTATNWSSFESQIKPISELEEAQ